MSNLPQPKRSPQSSAESQALAELIVARQELEQTRKRLFLLRTAVDSIIGFSPPGQSD